MEERQLTLDDIIKVLKENKKDLEQYARDEIAENLERLSILAESRYMEFTDLTWLDAGIKNLVAKAEKVALDNKAYEEASRYGAW